MKRAAIEKPRTLRTWRSHLRLTHADELLTGKVHCVCDKQANRFRKGQKQLGCGNSRCYSCHSEKLNNIPTIRDLRQRARQFDYDETEKGDIK